MHFELENVRSGSWLENLKSFKLKVIEKIMKFGLNFVNKKNEKFIVNLL